MKEVEEAVAQLKYLEEKFKFVSYCLEYALNERDYVDGYECINYAKHMMEEEKSGTNG